MRTRRSIAHECSAYYAKEVEHSNGLGSLPYLHINLSNNRKHLFSGSIDISISFPEDIFIYFYLLNVYLHRCYNNNKEHFKIITFIIPSYEQFSLPEFTINKHT